MMQERVTPARWPHGGEAKRHYHTLIMSLVVAVASPKIQLVVLGWWDPVRPGRPGSPPGAARQLLSVDTKSNKIIQINQSIK